MTKVPPVQDVDREGCGAGGGEMGLYGSFVLCLYFAVT